MIVIIALAALALVLLVAAFFSMPNARLSHASPATKWLLLATGLCILGVLGAASAIKVQEKTGVVTHLSGGLESDARQWLARMANMKPAQNQAGDNMQVLRDGLAFIKAHPTIATSTDGNRILQKYSGLPARPTKLLSREEERQYFDGATDVWRLIEEVSGASGSYSE